MKIKSFSTHQLLPTPNPDKHLPPQNPGLCWYRTLVERKTFKGMREGKFCIIFTAVSSQSQHFWNPDFARGKKTSFGKADFAEWSSKGPELERQNIRCHCSKASSSWRVLSISSTVQPSLQLRTNIQLWKSAFNWKHYHKVPRHTLFNFKISFRLTCW